MFLFLLRQQEPFVPYPRFEQNDFLNCILCNVIHYKILFIMSFIWFILIGLVSGFVAGKLMRGGGFGLVVNLVVGIIGGVLGGWLFGLLGIHTTSIIGSLICSVVGAIVLLWLVGLISRRPTH